MDKQKFFSIVDAIDVNENGCKIWPHCKDKNGYPNPRVNGATTTRGNRIILERKLGRKIKNNMHALHTCDNPSCLNPEHLWEGSNKENMHDKISKGRAKALVPGEKHYKAKVTNEQATNILSLAKEGKMTQVEIAKLYGVSTFIVWAIKNGNTFKFLKR